MKAVVAAFNQEKALVGAFSVIMNLPMELFEGLSTTATPPGSGPRGGVWRPRHPPRPASLQRLHPHPGDQEAAGGQGPPHVKRPTQCLEMFYFVKEE